MKKVLLPLLLACTAASLFAVNPIPYTEGVSFSVRLTGVGGGIMTVYEESPTAPSISHSSSGSTSESGINTAWLRPGKTYQVSFQASGPWEYWLSFIGPVGYEIFIDGKKRDLLYVNTGGGEYHHWYDIELRPVASSIQPAPYSSFSGISIGKSISWEIGLGTMHGDRNAGRIYFWPAA